MVQAFLKKWWVESDFKVPNLPRSLRLKVSGCHYNSIYNNTWTKQVKQLSNSTKLSEVNVKNIFTWRCFFLWAWLVVSPIFSTGFPALIHSSLTDTALELTCRSQVNFCPSIPTCFRSWTSSTGKSIVELSWFLLTVEMYLLVKSRSEWFKTNNFLFIMLIICEKSSNRHN